ncbi:hypothetical protein INR49_001170 [Caranx melampygus]|nr:hypothetical protein INR49_001170 [Caranx melampygus]
MASYQHPSFVDRVELRDPGMKDGDVSVILKNVTVNDTGSYESHVLLSGTGSSELRCIIHLSIEDSGDAHEDVWYRQITTLHILYTVIPVAVALVSLTVIVVAIKKCRGGQKAERAETQVQHDLSQEVHWPKVNPDDDECTTAYV